MLFSLTLPVLQFVRNLVRLMQARNTLLASALVSAAGFKATVYLIPIVQRLTLKRGMYGAPTIHGHLVDSRSSLQCI